MSKGGRMMLGTISRRMFYGIRIGRQPDRVLPFVARLVPLQAELRIEFRITEFCSVLRRTGCSPPHITA